ncbi:MAG: acetyl-CoA carboxylase biotin carboxyl carrier protein [Candidatus Melainabacteria bacterium]|nr:acetyl-CoA carboxylase biotin carboxyl carrier protein [Candidatus Melainabacteria bacterium]
MKIDLDQIRELLSVVGSTDVTELTIEFGDQRITVKKSPPVVAGADSLPIVMKTTDLLPAPQLPKLSLPTAEVQNETATANGGEASTNGLVEITSPMVGTFYQAPSPDAPPFVQIGDHVAVGQTVCIIEAMKLMNDMPAEVSGKVVKLLVDNGTTVEYGQPLFLVDPKG